MMSLLKPLEHKFKAILFAALKGTLRKRKPKSGPLDVNRIKRVLFLRQDRLGDMVVTLPIIDGLKKSFPHIEVSVLASPKNLPLIKNDKRFENIYLYTKNFKNDWSTLRDIMKERYDCIVDLLFDDSVTGLFLSQYLSNGRPIIGIGKEKYKKYYDYCFDNEKEHLIDNMLKILSAFGVDPEKTSGYGGPYIDTEKKSRAEEFFNSLAIDGNYAFNIGLNLSSGAPTRIWQEEKWVELINEIFEKRTDSKIILITMPSDRDKAKRVVSNFVNNVHVIPDMLDIVGVSAIIKKLDLLITPDTSLAHIARGYQVPVLGLYTRNERNFLIWHPYKMKNGAVRSVANDDIFDITVKQVAEKFIEIVGTVQEVKQ